MAILDDIRRTTIAMEAHLPLDREALIKQAHAEGKTWDEIAEAALLSKDGVRSIARNGIKNRVTDFLGLSTGTGKPRAEVDGRTREARALRSSAGQ